MLPANPKSYLSSDCELKCKIDGSEYNVCHRVLYPWIKKCLKWFWFCWQPVLILYFATNQTRPESSGEAVRATHSSEHPQSQARSFTIFILSSVNYFFCTTHPSLFTPSHRYKASDNHLVDHLSWSFSLSFNAMMFSFDFLGLTIFLSYFREFLATMPIALPHYLLFSLLINIITYDW